MWYGDDINTLLSVGDALYSILGSKGTAKTPAKSLCFHYYFVHLRCLSELLKII